MSPTLGNTKNPHRIEGADYSGGKDETADGGVVMMMMMMVVVVLVVDGGDAVRTACTAWVGWTRAERGRAARGFASSMYVCIKRQRRTETEEGQGLVDIYRITLGRKYVSNQGRFTKLEGTS